MAFEFSENVNAMFERLEKFFTSKTVVGEKIQIGNTTLIPLISLSFGLGTGGGEGQKGKPGEGEGEGGGIGAKASPIAIVVIKDEEVQVMSIGTPGGFEKLVEMVPEVLSKVMEKEKAAAKETETPPMQE